MSAADDSLARPVRQRITDLFVIDDRSETPPLPRSMSIELNNGCNHACYFCPNPTMTRPKTTMFAAMIQRVLEEGFAAGIREVAFYCTGEPLLFVDLPRYVAAAKAIGFSYLYLSTNGGRATSPRLLPVLDAGLDSLKFSINAGTRETYRVVHGVDDFDAVIANVERAAEYRARTSRPLRLWVSCVVTDLNRREVDILQQRLKPLVDDVVLYPFMAKGTPLRRHHDASGAERPFITFEHTNPKEGWNPLRLKAPCHQLWNAVNVRAEGYLTACCADFDNDLLVGDLKVMSLADAWVSPEFQALRRRHVENRLEVLVCHGCLSQQSQPYQPLTLHRPRPA
jgi:pyruvate-formate lyase-activating enzyme